MEKSLKEKTAQGLFWGGISSGMQQVLNLLFGIFLARMLNAEDYGMIGMLTIFSLISGTLQESGFTAALINKQDVTSRDYNAVFWSSVLIGCSLYLILSLCAPLIARFYGRPELETLSRFVFLGFVVTSTGTVPNAILSRNLMVKQKTIAQLSALLASGTVGVTLAYHGMAYWGLAVQNLVFVTVLMSIYWYFTPWRPSFRFDFRPLKTLFGFSSRMMATQLFTQINNNIFSVILGRFFQPSQVGYYTQANKWNMMGTSIINTMMNGVAQPVLAQVATERERQLSVFRKMLRFTSFVSFPCMFGLGLISNEFIVLAVTEKWLPSVPILQMLCIWGAFLPVTSMFSNLVISRGKSNIFMWNTIALGLIQLTLLLLLYPYGVHSMIAAFVTVNILWLGIWYHYVHREIGLTFMDMFRDIVPFCAIAFFAMIVTFFVTHTIAYPLLRMVAKIGLAVVLYLGILKIIQAKILNDCIDYLLNKRII